MRYGKESHTRPKGLEAPDWVGVQRSCWWDAVKKAIIQQRAGPLGLRLSSPGERERHNADGHKSGGSIYCSYVRSPTSSHTQTLSNPFRTLTIKWEVHIFLKKSSCVCLFIVSLWYGIWEYNNIKRNPSVIILQNVAILKFHWILLLSGSFPVLWYFMLLN